MSIHHQTTRGGPADRSASPDQGSGSRPALPLTLPYLGGTTTTPNDLYDGIYPVPDMKKQSGSGNGTDDTSDSILSLISHYYAFPEAIAANSAVAGFRDAPLVLPERVPPQYRYHSELQAISPFIPQKPFIVAVLPAYNEELSIGSIVVHSRHYGDAMIVVDDGSTDATSLIAREAGADVITFPENRGKAAAFLEGFAQARELDPDTIVMLDADGQHNPDEIPELLKPVLTGKADMVVGSRFLNGKNDIPAYRVLGQKTLDLATNAGTGTRSTDTQSGFRVLGRRAMLNLDFYSEGYNIESDMLSHFAQRGLTIGEVPIGVSYAVTNGHKKNPISHGLDVLSHIIGLIGYRRPLISFGVPGGVLTVIGAVSLLYTLTELYTGGAFHSVMFVGGISSLILGLLLVTTSLILNSLVQIVKLEKSSIKTGKDNDTATGFFKYIPK